MSSPAPKMTETAPPELVPDVGGPAPVEHEEIARLAYSYWEARGCPEGSPQEDWFGAEQELQRQRIRKRPVAPALSDRPAARHQ